MAVACHCGRIIERMVETVRYNYRLRPGAVAERALVEEWHRCRYLWNEAVHQQRSGGKPTFCKLSKLLTEARGTFAWLRVGSQVAQQQALRTYAAALNHSYKVGARSKPTVKARKKALPSLEYTTRGFSIRDNRLRLPNGVVTPVVWSRAYDLPYGGHRRRCAAELAKAQRKMARRRRARGQAPSKGYRRARLSAAKLHKKAARQNVHVTRQWVRGVVANHQIIAVEDFKPQFLARSTMARKAADAAIGAAKRELIERGVRAGRRVVLVPPAYTTMTCSVCYAIAKQRLGLGERVFRCEHCGYTADRDRNAARVILAMADPDHASADDVRHCSTPLGDATVRSELEIPPP